MRSPDEVYEDIESDRALREREIRLIENIASKTESDEERTMLHRSLVLLTYAHFEGFCKFALLAYTAAINALGLPCREASTPLAAASLGKVFTALRDLNSKHEVFAKAMPDDRDLHQLARQQRFLEEFEAIISKTVELSDKLVDTKANLNSVVLKKNLYQLGLPYPEVEGHRTSIDKMLGVRNAIAHGDALKRPDVKEVTDYMATAFDVMRFVQQEVYQALRNKTYRKEASGSA
jgi:hypothetical protein